MLFSNVKGMAKTLTTPCRQKGSASKIQVPCTDVIQMCNKGMGGVDFIHQRAAVYHLYRKPCIRFHFVHIFDLLDLACANSYIVYSMMHPNDLTLLDFETIFSTYLITRYESRNTAPPDGKRGSKRKDQYHFEQGNLSPHLPEIQNIQSRFEYCYKERNDLKTYVLWLI